MKNRKRTSYNRQGYQDVIALMAMVVVLLVFSIIFSKIDSSINKRKADKPNDVAITQNVDNASVNDASVDDTNVNSSIAKDLDTSATEIATSVIEDNSTSISTTTASSSSSESEDTNIAEPLESSEVEEIPVTATIEYSGYSLNISAYKDHAVVSYPKFITEDEVYSATESAYNAYSEYLDGVSVKVLEDGKAEIYYPESFVIDDFNVAIDILKKELPIYIESIVNTSNTVEDSSSIVEDTSSNNPLLYVSQTAPLKNIDNVEEKPVTATIEYSGYSLNISAYKDHAIVSYPKFITADEVYSATESAYNAYSEYLDGVSVKVLEDGKAEIYYPNSFVIDDFNIAIDILKKELPIYIESIVNPSNALDDSSSAVVDNSSNAIEIADDNETLSAVVNEVKEDKDIAIVDVEKETSLNRHNISIYATPYGFADRIEDGSSASFKRFVRSYMFSLTAEYDYRVNSLLTVGAKLGYDGVTIHGGTYFNQIPILATVGLIPYESEHSRIAIDFGLGIDVYECIDKSTFAPIMDLSFVYSYKLNDSLYLGVGSGIRFQYSVSDNERRWELPLNVGITYSL